MQAQAVKEGVAPVRDRLMTTLFLAALFHGIVILGVSFTVAGLEDAEAIPTLEVLLVNEQMPEALSNPDAAYLAQRSQQGSGNIHEGRTANPASLPEGVDNAGSPDGQALADREGGTARESQSVLAQQGAGPASGAESTDAGPTQTALLMTSGPRSPLPSADDDDELALKGEHLDVLLLTPNARASEVAVYLDGWKRKVERVGTLNFPSRLGRGRSGNPVLEVAIRADGHLEEARIRRSSGHAELDQTALAILKLATPFDPFPADLRARHPVLRFAYEWQFLRGAPVDSTIRSR